MLPKGKIMKVMDVPAACLGLSIIRAEDHDCFQAAMEQADIRSHHYHFPRLLFSGQRERRLLLFEQVSGSVLLYSLHQRESGLGLNLYVPPFPFQTQALQWAQDRMRDFNRGRGGQIEWVQEKDIPLIEGHGFLASLREQEFIYDRAAVVALQGSQFARVRRYLASLKKYDELVVRSFTPADEAGCMALYRKFRTQLKEKGIEPKGLAAMANCLKDAVRLPASRMQGEVFEVDGTVRAYSFGGPINSVYGCVFLTVADHDFPGLAYALRHQMMKNFPDLSYFNDSTDNNRPGLREMKQRFRPVEMHSIYKAQEARRGSKGSSLPL